MRIVYYYTQNSKFAILGTFTNCTQETDEIKQAFDELYQTMTGKPFKEKGYLRHLLPLQPPPAKVPHQRPQTHTRNKYSINSKSPVHSELGFCESFMLCG